MMKSAHAILLLSAVSLLPASAFGQDTPKPVAPAPALPGETPPSSAPPAASDAPAVDASTSIEKKVDELEQRIRIAERKWEIEQEALADRKAEEKKNPPGVAVGYAKDGVAIKTADNKFQFRLRPVIQADGRFFIKSGSNTFLLRRVRPVIEGTAFEFFDWRMMPELAGTPNVQDAFVNIRLIKEVQLRGGKFKPPVGIERLASDPDLQMIERGLSTNLVPDRDVGLQLHGELLDGTVTYAGGIFNGVGDGVNGDVDNNDKKDLAGRIFVYPFKQTSVEPLQKLGLGFAATRGTQVGPMPIYRSAAQATVFQYAATALASGTHRRIVPQASFFFGPLGVYGEWVRSSQIVSNGTSTQRMDHESWVVIGSVFVTGEDASYTTVTPKEQLNPAKGTFGALEVVGRYGELKLDPETFRLRFADTNASVGKAKAWAVGLNWHLGRGFKLMADYEKTDFEGGARGGARPSEIVVLTRLQAAY
jgi:phosphate-selective porin OprO/OprP